MKAKELTIEKIIDRLPEKVQSQVTARDHQYSDGPPAKRGNWIWNGSIRFSNGSDVSMTTGPQFTLPSGSWELMVLGSEDPEQGLTFDRMVERITEIARTGVREI